MAGRECDAFEKLMVFSLEEALSGRAERRLQGHLEACPACRDLFARHCRLRRGLAALPPEPVPAHLPGLPEDPVPGRFSLPVRLSATAALALLIMMTVLIGNRCHRDRPEVYDPVQYFSPAAFLSSDWLWINFFDTQIVSDADPLLPELEDYYLMESFSQEERLELAELLRFI